MSFSAAKCPFCRTDSRYIASNNRHFYEYDCSICGVFSVSQKVEKQARENTNGYAFLNCISENIKSNSQDTGASTAWLLENEPIPPNIHPNTSAKRLEHFLSLPIIHSDKPVDILLMVAEGLNGQDPFTEKEVFKTDILKLKIKDHNELYTWLDQLNSENLITYSKPQSHEVFYETNPKKQIEARVLITPQGWSRVFENKKSLNSKKVFIAMQFEWGEDANQLKIDFIDAIKEACRACGYEANIVTEHHTGPIMDKIIASIKESHFMIADFTFNNRGAYFEAGYARALGIPVIHTVMNGHTDNKDDDRKRLHFDIQQINYINWKSPKDAELRIRERIKAVIR